MVLLAAERELAKSTVIKYHYSHSVPAGKTHWFGFQEAFVSFSLPANPYIARYLLGAENGSVWELTRLWAPDHHGPNLLTQAIKCSVAELRKLEPGVVALVAYADPNVGHEGGVYRAASWVYTGQSSESRRYVDLSGQVVARRAFHSGHNTMRKAEIEALGYNEVRAPGKHRYARGLTRSSRRLLAQKFSAIPPAERANV